MRLADYLDTRGISDADFAEAIGTSRQTVHRYRIGERKPEWEILSKIRDVTRGEVTPDDFLPPERKTRRRQSEATQ